MSSKIREEDYKLKVTEADLESFIGKIINHGKEDEMMLFGDNSYIHKAELEAMQNWIKEQESKIGK